MRLLLDTHLLLWAVASSKRLPREVRDLLEDGSHDVYFSAASIWEIAIKSALRRQDFRVDLAAMQEALLSMRLIELPVSAAHAARVAGLPRVHQDPFDRLLVAQSLIESMPLVSADTILDAYGINRLW